MEVSEERLKMFHQAVGTDQYDLVFSSSHSMTPVIEQWEQGLTEFNQKRKSYLLY